MNLITRLTERFDNKKIGILMMLISAFCFAIMGIAVKLAADIPVYEKVFFRNFFSVFLAYSLVKKNNASLLGKKSSLPLLVGRSTAGMLGVITMFYALSNIDVATATTIQKLSQFWVLVFASLFLGEKIKPKQYLFIIVALIGVIIVSKPSTPTVLIPVLSSFASSILAGIAYTFLSKLRRYEHPSTIVFFFSMFSTVVMLIPTVLNFKMFTPYEFILLLIIGLSAMGGQITLTSAYHQAKASEVSIYAYMNIVFSAIIAFMIWGTLPDTASLIGIAIIVLAGYMNFDYVRKIKTV